MSDQKVSLGIPQPYHVPGYVGHCPDVKYRLGKTFGLATHLAMCDPRVNHASQLALSRNRVQDLGEDYGMSRLIRRKEIRKQLEQEVMLLKGTRRPRSVQDRTLMDCPPMPLRPVTYECQGYKRPLTSEEDGNPNLVNPTLLTC